MRLNAGACEGSRRPIPDTLIRFPIFRDNNRTLLGQNYNVACIRFVGS